MRGESASDLRDTRNKQDAGRASALPASCFETIG
jgi:hypothetical protein